jgi:hypothetical protein
MKTLAINILSDNLIPYLIILGAIVLMTLVGVCVVIRGQCESEEDD